MRRLPRNTPGPARPQSPAPPIDPALTYPLARLADWGFGPRSVAALQRAGLETFKFGKMKFFSGAGLIAVLRRGGQGAGEAGGGRHDDRSETTCQTGNA